MRSCLKNDGLIAGSFRPPPDAAFGSAPKLYRIPYWLKGGEGVNLNFLQANSPATILAVAYDWSANLKNEPLLTASLGCHSCQKPRGRRNGLNVRSLSLRLNFLSRPAIAAIKWNWTMLLCSSVLSWQLS